MFSDRYVMTADNKELPLSELVTHLVVVGDENMTLCGVRESVPFVRFERVNTVRATTCPVCCLVLDNHGSEGNHCGQCGEYVSNCQESFVKLDVVEGLRVVVTRIECDCGNSWVVVDPDTEDLR
jgi:tRNA(Ile2) C34 agmatinyltransferase TiaS